VVPSSFGQPASPPAAAAAGWVAFVARVWGSAGLYVALGAVGKAALGAAVASALGWCGAGSAGGSAAERGSAAGGMARGFGDSLRAQVLMA
jgi:hypothetical protein